MSPVPSATSTSSGPSAVQGAPARVTRFRLSVLLGAALFAPAAFLVLRGNLSVLDALLRFGCALLVGAAGTGLVLATVPGDGAIEPVVAPAHDEPAPDA
jgi:hypothetical protein